MPLTRREFMTAAVALGASRLAGAGPLVSGQLEPLLPRGRVPRVVIVGGGWGGLSAARSLREAAPELEVVLIEKNPSFWSCPLSNRWLIDLVDMKFLVHDYGVAAKHYGYRYVQAEVAAIDREQRRIVTSSGVVDYDWLVLAIGIRYDYASLLGDDRQAIAHTRQHYPCAFIPGDEARTLKTKLEHFAGGDLLMTLPPQPYRCPPAPYERAAMIGHWLKTRKIKGRLIVLDPNPLMQSFSRVFEQQYRDQIVYVPHAAIKSFDPFNKNIVTDFDDIHFDDAIIMAPQQAGDLLWQADLVGRDAQGNTTGWANQDAVHLHAADDERVFLIGDSMGKVSPLFGHYPKTGQMASRLGKIAAYEIATRARGGLPEKRLPDSVCYVYTNIEPLEMLRLEASYKFRGDGAIVQTNHQSFNPLPHDEDLQWAQQLFGDFFGYRT